MLNKFLFTNLRSFSRFRSMVESAENFVYIDGSLYEGGGQMFRNSLALSTILEKPVVIQNIRANRPNPGINRQLSTGISIMAQVSGCKVEGNVLKSQKVTFAPKKIKSGKDRDEKRSFRGDCQTAGSIALMTQMILPALLFGKETTKVNLKGGTCVAKSPTVRYFEKILFPLLKQFGIEANVNINLEGFFPMGGGEADLTVEPLGGKGLKPISLTQPGKIKQIFIQVITNQNDEETATSYLKEIKKEAKKIMRTKYSEEEVDGIEITIDYLYSEHLMKSGLSSKVKQAKSNKAKNYHPDQKGPKRIVYGILFFASGDNIYYDCSCVCNDSVPNDDVYVENVIETFRSYFNSGSCMDDHLQDQIEFLHQLLIFMLLASGKSEIKCTKNITEHTQSCFYIFKEFFPDFKYRIVPDQNGELAVIQIKGMGTGVEGEVDKKNKANEPKENATENTSKANETKDEHKEDN